MGGGGWTKASYDGFIRGKHFAKAEDISKSSVQAFYESRKLDPALDPYDVIRECCDSEEHPETFPIILALDVTGSMGQAAKDCAAKLDDIMTELYGKVKDVEFMMMGIGDLAYDQAPIQASQFESDIRILDQTSKIWFENGGGPNEWESYTAAWYFGLYRTKLDCWKRGKKGVIITMGDEMLNPYLPGKKLINFSLGDLGQNSVTSDVDTKELYAEACKKFDIFHIGVTNGNGFSGWVKHEAGYVNRIRQSWKSVIGQNYIEGSSDDLPKLIGDIVDRHLANAVTTEHGIQHTPEGIRW